MTDMTRRSKRGATECQETPLTPVGHHYCWQTQFELDGLSVTELGEEEGRLQWNLAVNLQDKDHACN